MMLLLFYSLLSLICGSNCRYNILILDSPIGTPGHSIYFNGIAQQLAARGHKVTHRGFVNFDETENVDNYVVKPYHPEEFLFNALFNDNILRQHWYAFHGLYETILPQATNLTYNDWLIKNLINRSSIDVNNVVKYDVILIDSFFGDIFLPLAHHLQVPIILASSTILLPFYAWNRNVPFPYYLNVLALSSSLDLIPRTMHFVLHSFLREFSRIANNKIEQSTKIFLPKSPPIKDLFKSVSLVMTAYSDVSMDSVPTTPTVVNIQCPHCRPAKPLPKDLEDIMMKSGEHGVIYFSMGSFLSLNLIPKVVVEKFQMAFAQLPQIILWKGNLKDRNQSNIYTRQWLPQQDILGHPKVKLVISHGGLGTMQETSYHGCPIIGFPLSADHDYSMHLVQKNGYGEYFDWRTFSADRLVAAISSILNNKSYKESVLVTSRRMRDTLGEPASQAAFWTEYVIRHKQTLFLTSTLKLSWYQYFLLDVLVLIFAAAVTAVIIIYWTTKLIIKSIWRILKHVYYGQ